MPSACQTSSTYYTCLVQDREFATGLDSGVCYGFQLTALVIQAHEAAQQVPQMLHVSCMPTSSLGLTVAGVGCTLFLALAAMYLKLSQADAISGLCMFMMGSIDVTSVCSYHLGANMLLYLHVRRSQEYMMALQIGGRSHAQSLLLMPVSYDLNLRT